MTKPLVSVAMGVYNGVKETFKDRISRLSFEFKNKNDLLEKVQLFLSISLKDKGKWDY